MKRVLLSLLACIALLVAAWGGLQMFGKGTGMPARGAAFLRIYTEAENFQAVQPFSTPEFMTQGANEEPRKRRVVRRHLGKFKAVGKVLIERVRVIGGGRIGELQFLGHYAKGTALTRLYFAHLPDGWRVKEIEVDIPPKLMRLSLEKFAEMIGVEAARRIVKREWGALQSMSTEDFQVKFPAELLAEAVGPLLEERSTLKNVGVQLNEAAGRNQHDVRVIAFFDEGLPLGFDLLLRWEENRWKLHTLAVEEAPGASVPRNRLHPPTMGGG